MRLAVLSDIHGNLPALEAGFEEPEFMPDEIWEQAAVKFGIGVS